MKKLIFTTLFATSAVFAYTAQVKKADITVTVNSKDKSLKKGDSFDLSAGDIVCYKDGDGRLVIKGDSYTKQLSKKSSPCQKLPTDKKKSEDVKVMAMVASVFAKSQEESVNGVSRKDTQIKEQKKEIKLDKSKKYILVENRDWGPLPVTLTIVDANGKVISSYENAEDDVTSFLIPTDRLKSGYTLKVTNAFGDSLAVVKIK